MSESLISLFDDSVARFHKRPAIQYFCTKNNKWVVRNWQELSADVARLANALKAASVTAGQRVALLSLTRPEWVIADLAIIKTGAIVVPIYHSSLTDQVSYILSDAGVKVIFVENQNQLDKLRALQGADSQLDLVIIFDKVEGELRQNELYYQNFVENQADEFESISVEKDAIASLVYTSGTTGEPKGAMISHDNILYEAHVIDKLGIINEEDVQMLFLPLAHIFARVLEYAWIRTGHLLAFAQSIDKLMDDMAVVRPTFMAGVPRIYEKIRAKIIETALASSGIKKLIAQGALHEADKLALGGESGGWKLFLAKKLVFDKIGKSLQAKFGNRLRFLISGGAQLAPEVSTFFQLCGVVLCEGYGLTETTAATCLNLPWALRHGTVGRPLPGCDVRLSDEKEIIVRGRGVFLGFWGKAEQTKEVLGQDGWFKTGDIGEIDKDGFVKIVDRKKDIIVTSQGKNIAPQRVENLIKSKSPSIAHVVVIGDKRPYLTALVALDKANAAQLAFSDASHNILLSELAAHANVYQEVKNAIAQANNSLANFEQIKRFYILDREFEVGKQLTPTLKVKRKACAEEFKAEIKVLYA
ncbi:MAG: long-chain fatty acid--CoA ligase [Myxococcales bacterium]|nr:long-chain fatty acid--CoA ligase [Myxococcales bacterium]USN51737.1 MAG: long-chain fatty acid--CoA ligase [Myxococcales bacterium]